MLEWCLNAKLFLYVFFICTAFSPLASYGLDLEQADKISFEINKLEIEGNTLLSSSELEAVTNPLLTKNGTIDQLEKALLAVEKAYAERGFTAVKAVLPEQEAADGTFKIIVLEAKLHDVRITGNHYFDEDNILNTVPNLVKNQPPNLIKIAKTLRISNESYAKNTRVIFSRGSSGNDVDAELKVIDSNPVRYAFSLDNTGTKQTGRARASFVYQSANLFNRDHAMALQYTTSPEHSNDVSIFGLSYRIPVYTLSNSIDLSAGHSDVNSGSITTTAGTYGISGSGDYLSANYNLSLPTWHDIDPKIVFSANWKSFNSRVVPQGSTSSVIPDLTSLPLALTLNATSNSNSSQWQSSIGWVHNIPSGSKGNTAAYNQQGARPGADAEFNLLRYSLSYQRLLASGWVVRADVGGQLTNDMLISGEQYGVGGAYSVRGFNEREISGDAGYKATLEFSSPAWEAIKIPSARSYSVLFLDGGQVTRNNPLARELSREFIASAGGGFRIASDKVGQLKLDVARVLDGDGIQKPGNWYGHFQYTLVF